MIVVKRDGRKQDFDPSKIENAVNKAFLEVDGEVTEAAQSKSREISKSIEETKKPELGVEDIQDMIENKLMASRRKDVAKAFIIYRNKRAMARRNTIDETLNEYLSGTNEYWNTENSNKNAGVLSTQRDYLAGIVSTDFSRRYLLPPDIVKAHDEGIIHFHDIDYFAENAISNCCLINLGDMLQNGTVVNNVLIEKPHKFLTACTIATQIILGVSSNQYGGCTITLTHLAPFLRQSKKYYYKKYKSWGFDKKTAKRFVDLDLQEELEAGVQTFNYQVNSMTNSNGQAPFLSIFMYLNEDPEYKEEIAMITEEFLKQRILGFKNQEGVYITPAFPKLLYVLEEDNINENGEYFWLTKLAAKCTAKRMVPDYISEKKMKELKGGDCFPCMGCVSKNEVIDYTVDGFRYVESFERAWNRLSKYSRVKKQPNGKDDMMTFDDMDVRIWDSEAKAYVGMRHMIRNHTNDWINLTFSNGRALLCTPDHPFETNNGVKRADELTVNDKIPIDTAGVQAELSMDMNYPIGYAWCLGVICEAATFKDHFRLNYELHNTQYLSDNVKEKFLDLATEMFGLRFVEHQGNNASHFTAEGFGEDLFTDYLREMFGTSKRSDDERAIPNDIFRSDFNSKLEFLAGIIDASETHIEDGKLVVRCYGKSLTLQKMILVQSLGMTAFIDGEELSFVPSAELMEVLVDKPNITAREDLSNRPTYCQLFSRTPMKFNGFSYDVTTESEHFTVSGIYSHNCRSFLMPYKDENGKSKYYGRLNMGVVTINLPDVAFSSHGDMDEFWKIFDERLELCHKALRIRYERLAKVTSDVAPLLWQHGAFARLKKHEPIKPLLHNNYASISLGYAGLYECVKYMTGHSHSDEGEGHDFAIAVMKHIKDKCDEWQNAENIGYSPYGSPIETTTGKFARCLKKRFGDDVFIKLDGHDREYITNSVHVPVFEEIDPFKKLKIEAEFQPYSTGGYISYIECGDLTRNPDVVIEVLKYIYDNTMYAELNTKSDYCQKCGYDGEIKIIDVDGKLDWECPNCGNRDHSTLNVARRTCGYIGSNFWSAGRTNEIRDRVTHLDDKDADICESAIDLDAKLDDKTIELDD